MRNFHTRFYWPMVCGTCKRTPLFYFEFVQRCNVGTDWEDSLSETVCLPCYIKSIISIHTERFCSRVKRLFSLVLPLFFTLVFKIHVPVKRAWKMTKVFRK